MSNNRDVSVPFEHEKTPEQIVRGHIHRILGREKLAQPVTAVLAKLDAGDRPTWELFLTDAGEIDQSEVVTFANLHRPQDAFVIDVPVRRLIEL